MIKILNKGQKLSHNVKFKWVQSQRRPNSQSESKSFD